MGGLRVLQVLGDTDDGDPGRVALDLHDALGPVGLEVRTVALGPGRVGGLDRMVPVLGPARRSLAAHTQLRREQRWADVVVLWGEGSAAVAALASVRGAPPTVLALGEEPHRWQHRPVPGRVRHLLGRLAGLVVTDPGSAEVLASLGLDGPVPDAIAYGVARRPPVTAAARRVARDELGLAPDGPVARWVGDPAGEDDGRAVAGRAAAAAGVALLGVDGPDRVGGRAELVEAAADIAVLPTRRRAGPPRGLLLAARAGSALVAPGAGALGGLVDQRTGRSAAPDPDATAAALTDLAGDVAVRTAAGESAAALAARLFSLDGSTADWRQVLTAAAG